MKLASHYWITLVLTLVSNSYASAQEPGTTNMTKPTGEAAVVVFVCEHGSAKSVVAAAHFNKLARERNLNVHAVSRGTYPDEEIAPKALEGLRADGVAFGGEKPKKLSRADVAGAIRVVAFCRLPDGYSNSVSVEQWDSVPPVSEDYNKARDAIINCIRLLLDKLESPK